MTETEQQEIDRGLDVELRDRRPDPGRQFEQSLRERLVALEADSRRPEHLQAMVWAYLASGLLLLLLAAISAGGGGPFG